MSQQYPVSESKQVQSKISEVVEKLQKIKIAYLSSELEQLRANSSEISHDLYLLRIALEDWPEGWETTSSLIRRTLTEVKRFSEIRLSTLNQDTTYAFFAMLFKQNSVNTNKTLEELEKFYDEGLIAIPLKKSIFSMLRDLMEILQDLRKAQTEFENDFLPLLVTTSDDEAKQPARKLGITQSEVKASSKAMPFDQFIMVTTDTLGKILKETEVLANHVGVLGDNFNLHADDVLITQSHQSQMLQENIIQLEKLRASVLEITQSFEVVDDVKPLTSVPSLPNVLYEFATARFELSSISNLVTGMGLWAKSFIGPSPLIKTSEPIQQNSEILILRRQILELLAVTERHLDLLNQISKLMQRFRTLQTFFTLDNHLRYDWWQVFYKNAEQRKIFKETQEIRQNLDVIPEAQRQATLKLLDAFQDIQNKLKVTMDEQEARIKEETHLLDQALTVPKLVESIEKQKFGLIIEKIEKRLRLNIPDAPNEVRTLFKNLSEAFNSARSQGMAEHDDGEYVIVATESKKQKIRRIQGVKNAQSEIMYSVIAVLHDELSNSPDFFYDPKQEKDFYNRVISLLDLLQELTLNTYEINTFRKYRETFYQKRVFTDTRRVDAYDVTKIDKQKLKTDLRNILPVKESWRLDPEPQEDVFIVCTSIKLPSSKVQLKNPDTLTNTDEKNRDVFQDFKEFNADSIPLLIENPTLHSLMKTPDSKEMDIESCEELPRTTGYCYVPRDLSQKNDQDSKERKSSIEYDAEIIIFPATEELESPESDTDRTDPVIPPSFSDIFATSTSPLETKPLQLQIPLPLKSSVPRSFSYFFGPSVSVSDTSPSPETKDLQPRAPSIPPIHALTHTPQLGKLLAIGFGIFLVGLMTGAALPTVVSFMVGKDKTLEFLFSTNEGMCILGGYTGLQGLLGISLIAVSVYWFCKSSDSPRQLNPPRIAPLVSSFPV